MEFLNSVHSNYNQIKACIQQENIELLRVLVPTQTENFLFFRRFSSNNIHDNHLHDIITGIINFLYLQLRECNTVLFYYTQQNHVQITHPVIRLGDVGRPKLSVPTTQITLLRNRGLSWSKIAKTLNIGRVTLWKRRNQNLIADNRTPSLMTDEELRHVINEMKREHPLIGYRYIWGSLKTRGIYITWKRLISLVQQVDPVGVLSRRRRRLKRRQYKVKASNYMWCMDGNEKLVNWNIYIHGCADGYSRKIVYLQAALNKEAETVLSIFVEGVAENGLPMRVRGDYGTENVRGVIDYMNIERQDIQNPFLQGKSVHNVRIERFWGEVKTAVTFKFRNIFLYLESEDLLSQRSYLDIMRLSYVYLPRIQRSLLNFKYTWNHHPLTIVNYSSPEQLWLTSLLRLSHEKDVISLKLVPASIDVNSSPCPPTLENVIENIHQNLSTLITEPAAVEHFMSVAQQLIPDPLFNDDHEGVTLYNTLRNHFLNE